MSSEIVTRERYEAEEATRLSPRAALSAESRGRARPEEADPYRTDYQRDRDRIVHSKAFRRLSHKTQVFFSPEGDHYRTRLTHTLEVSQISRTIARALHLNEDLTEAVALGHDLGHTPFGHTGEEALDAALKELSAADPQAMTRYRHNEQGLRVVEHLEYDGKGLNLTWEVRDGILRHTGSKRAATLEGQIVAICDRVAYVNHDIDDAIRAGVLTEADLPPTPIAVLGSRANERISTMVNSLIKTTAVSDSVQMDEQVYKAMMDLRSFLFDNVYLSEEAKADEPKAYEIVRTLFDHYLRNPENMPPEERPRPGQSTTQAVVDYVSGMTDRFAIRVYEQLTGERF